MTVISALEYWVYENWTVEHKAVAHAGPCGFCKHGAGTDKRKPRGDANGMRVASLQPVPDGRRQARLDVDAGAADEQRAGRLERPRWLASDLFDRRRRLMDDWSAYLASEGP